MRVNVEIIFKNGNKISFYLDGSKEFLNERFKVFQEAGSELTVTFHTKEHYEFNRVAVNMKDIDFVSCEEHHD